MTDDDIKLLIAGQARIEQKVEDMNSRLFGNGQPGVIQHLNSKSTSLEEKVTEISTKMATNDADHAAVARTTAKFWSGVGAVGSLVGGLFMDWLLHGRK